MKHPVIISLVACVCLHPHAIAADKSPREEPPRSEVKVDVVAQLQADREALKKMLLRYTEKHPAVIAQRQKIAKLEKELATQ